MKLSDKTIGILQNFSKINQNIMIKQGKKLKTISIMKNILAEADVTEDFDKDFGIYDLNEMKTPPICTKIPKCAKSTKMSI